ncbi:MAG: hypothetical protein H0T45_07215 [Pyrinomonadaceae bacterium]|nr:hypothetical protein [Pyrinomonadaceae bacterium]
METESLPIACLLTAPELQERRRTVLQKFRSAVTEVKELEAGYSYSLPADGEWLAELANLVDLERQCCPFHRFNIIVEPAGRPIVLEITGPAGTKEFLEATFNQIHP